MVAVTYKSSEALGIRLSGRGKSGLHGGSAI